MRKVGGGPVVSGEFDAITGESLRSADDVGLIIRADAHPVPARAGLERASQQIRLAFAVKIDGAIVVAVPHLQCGAVELHAGVLGLGALEYRAGEDIAFELARRHLVGRDGASRDLDSRHTVCRELVGGDGTSDNLGRIDRISGQLIRIHRVGGQLIGRDSIGGDVARLNLMHIQQRHGHILSDLQLRGRDGIRGELVGADGIGLHLASSHRISSQFIRIDRASGELVGRDGISRNVARLNLVDVEQGHRHILSDLQLARSHRIGRDLVGRDGQCDDVPRLHRVGGEFRGGHRVGHQLFSRDRIRSQLVHRDGIGLDLLSGHGVGSEMLRGHGSSSEDVVRHEVEWLESRTVPCQDFHHAISERHQDAW